MKKIRNWSLLIKIISTFPMVLFFKTTDLHNVYIPILWICRQLKHHQLRIRKEIFISLEIILNAFNVWQYHFPLKSLFWLKHHFFIFQLASSVNLLCCQMCTFYSPLRKKICTLPPDGTDVHIWQHIHQKD